MSIESGDTFAEEIQRVPAGKYIIYETGRMRPQRFETYQQPCTNDLEILFSPPHMGDLINEIDPTGQYDSFSGDQFLSLMTKKAGAPIIITSNAIDNLCAGTLRGFIKKDEEMSHRDFDIYIGVMGYDINSPPYINSYTLSEMIYPNVVGSRLMYYRLIIRNGGGKPENVSLYIPTGTSKRRKIPSPIPRSYTNYDAESISYSSTETDFILNHDSPIISEKEPPKRTTLASPHSLKLRDGTMVRSNTAKLHGFEPTILVYKDQNQEIKFAVKGFVLLQKDGNKKEIYVILQSMHSTKMRIKMPLEEFRKQHSNERFILLDTPSSPMT